MFGCLVLLAQLAGCVSSHVLVGTPRPPISPEQVKVYLHPPAKYEEIALLDTSSRASFTPSPRRARPTRSSSG
jgi:hypothetical protein